MLIISHMHRQFKDGINVTKVTVPGKLHAYNPVADSGGGRGPGPPPSGK